MQGSVIAEGKFDDVCLVEIGRGLGVVFCGDEPLSDEPLPVQSILARGYWKKPAGRRTVEVPDRLKVREAGDFDEEEHPRHPKGDPRGGQFAPKGEGQVLSRDDPSRASEFEEEVDEGINVEWEDVAKEVERYTHDNDPKGIERALAHRDYRGYRQDLQRALKRSFGEAIPVVRKEGYAGDGRGVGEYVSVSLNQDWEGTKYWVLPEDVVLAGHQAEGELIVRRAGLKPAPLEPTDLPAHVKKAFTELHYEQRGAAENAMSELAQYQFGVPEASENLGDLINRMTDTRFPGWGYENVKSKVASVLRNIEADGPWTDTDKILDAQIQVSAKEKKESVEARREKVFALMTQYAREHAKLPVYNRAQWLAREACKSFGNRNFVFAKAHLHELRDMLKDPITWRKNASQFEVGEDGKPIPYEPKRSDDPSPLHTTVEVLPVEGFSHLDEDDEYYYHVTSAENAKRIAETGRLEPNASPILGRYGNAGHSSGNTFLSERGGVSFWAARVEEHMLHMKDYDEDEWPEIAVVRIPKILVDATIRLREDPHGTRDAHAKAYMVQGPINIGEESDEEIIERRYGHLSPGKQLHAQDTRQQLAKVAQQVYDEWKQDEEGYDEEYGTGGICQDIAGQMADVLNQRGFEATTVSAATGEQHVWVVARGRDGVFSVDIPPWVYEEGGGYNWKKKADIQIEAGDIIVDRLDSDPREMRQYVDEWEEDEDDPSPGDWRDPGPAQRVWDLPLERAYGEAVRLRQRIRREKAPPVEQRGAEQFIEGILRVAGSAPQQVAMSPFVQSQHADLGTGDSIRRAVRLKNLTSTQLSGIVKAVYRAQQAGIVDFDKIGAILTAPFEPINPNGVASVTKIATREKSGPVDDMRPPVWAANIVPALNIYSETMPLVAPWAEKMRRTTLFVRQFRFQTEQDKQWVEELLRNPTDARGDVREIEITLPQGRVGVRARGQRAGTIPAEDALRYLNQTLDTIRGMEDDVQKELTGSQPHNVSDMCATEEESVEATILHELGHVACAQSQNLTDRVFRVWNMIHQEFQGNPEAKEKWIASQPSGYAHETQDPEEWFAENFSAYGLGWHDHVDPRLKVIFANIGKPKQAHEEHWANKR